jgi:hypothetical protein
MIGLFIWVRATGNMRTHPVTPIADRIQADEVVSVLATLLLVTFAIGQNSFGVFRSRVEARFVIASHVPPARAIAYLVARDAVLLSGRFAISIAYLLFVTIPRSVGAWQFVGDLVFVLAASMALVVAMLPRRLARRPYTTLCASVGYALAFVAIIPAIAGALDQFFARSAAAKFFRDNVPAWHPGLVLLQPNGWWITLAVGLAAVSIGVLILMTRDAYPELYDLSTKQIDMREALAGKTGFAARMEAVRGLRQSKLQRVTSASGAPPGVLIFVWRSVIEFRRRSSLRNILGGFAFWGVAGYVCARLALSRDGVFAGALIGGFANVLIILSSTAGSALAHELRRPIFWLSRAWLPERVGGFALGQWWPPCLRAFIGATGVAFAGESAGIVATVALGLPALFALLLGTGYAAFALFPDAIDQRGPLALIRIVVTYILIAPPLAFFVVLTFVFVQPLMGLVGFTVLAIVEALLLVGFAAWRLDGRIDRLAAV